MPPNTPREEVDAKAKTVLEPLSQPKPLEGFTESPITVIKGNAVDTVQKQTKAPILAMVLTSLIGGAGATVIGYKIAYKHWPWVDETVSSADSGNQNVQTEGSSASSLRAETSTPSIPKVPYDIIDTPAKLAATLDAFHIRATASDFEKLAEQNPQLEALRLEGEVLEPGTSQESVRLTWKPLQMSRINELPEEDDIIIATRKVMPAFSSAIQYVGLRPKTSLQDVQDPSIQYDVYACRTDSAPTPLSQLSVFQKGKRGGKELAWLSVKVPKCKKTASEE